MKTTFALGLALLLQLLPAQAESFEGSMSIRSGDRARPRDSYNRSHHSISYGFGYYGPGYSLSYGYYPGAYGYYPSPYVYRAAPVYVYDGGYYNTVDARPDYLGNGLTLGAIAGAIIGNNSGSLGHNAWRGAAYGAGAGLLIGALAENNARRVETASAVTSTSPRVTAPPPAPVAVAPSRVIMAPAAPASSMGDANRMFGRN